MHSKIFLQSRSRYAKTDENVVIVAALVMNPTIKWTYLKRKWTCHEERQWLRNTQAKIQRLWDMYKDRDLTVNESSTQPGTSMDHSIDNFLRPPPTMDDSEPIDDEYDRYCRCTVATTDDLIKWWVGNKLEYPDFLEWHWTYSVYPQLRPNARGSSPEVVTSLLTSGIASVRTPSRVVNA